MDWSQNNPHKTTIASYSLRGRARPDRGDPGDVGRGARACRRPERPGVHRRRPAGPDRRARRPDGRAARRAAAAAPSAERQAARLADAPPDTPTSTAATRGRTRTAAGTWTTSRAARTPWPRSAAPSRRASATSSWTCTPARTGWPSCTTTRCWTAPPTARGRSPRAPPPSWAKVRVRGREPIPRLEQVLTELPDTRITDRAEVRRRRGAGARRCWSAPTAWHRVCLGSYRRRLARPGPARLAGPRLCTSMAQASAFGLRSRAWLDGAARPVPRLPGPPVQRQPGPAAAPLRPAHRGRRGAAAARPTRPAARCTCGRSTIPAEMAELLDLGVDGILSDRPDLLREVLGPAASAWIHP